MDDLLLDFKQAPLPDDIDSKYLRFLESRYLGVKHVACESETRIVRLTSVCNREEDHYVKEYFPCVHARLRCMAEARSRTLRRIADLPEELGDRIFDATVRCSLPSRLLIDVDKSYPEAPLTILAKAVLAGSVACETGRKICEDNGLFPVHSSWIKSDATINDDLTERVEKSILRSSEIVSTVRFPSASNTTQLLYPHHLASRSTLINALHLSISLPQIFREHYPAQIYAAQRALPRLRDQLPHLKKVTMTVVEQNSSDAHGLTRGHYLAGIQGWSSYRSHQYTELSTELAKIVVAMQALKLPSAAFCFYGDGLLKEEPSVKYVLEAWKPQQAPRGNRKVREGADADAIVAEAMEHEGYDCWM